MPVEILEMVIFLNDSSVTIDRLHIKRTDGTTVKHRHRRNVMSYRFKSLLKLFSLFSLL